eukprot:357958-Chlamydomonas_euryale.AAC.3
MPVHKCSPPGSSPNTRARTSAPKQPAAPTASPLPHSPHPAPARPSGRPCARSSWSPERRA